MEALSSLQATSSLFLQMTEQQLTLLNSHSIQLSSSCSGISSAAHQLASYDYSDSNYTEQEVAVYQHEDEETREMLRAQIDTHRAHVTHVDAQLAAMLDQLTEIERLTEPWYVLLTECGEADDVTSYLPSAVNSLTK